MFKPIDYEREWDNFRSLLMAGAILDASNMDGLTALESVQQCPELNTLAKQAFVNRVSNAFITLQN